MALHPCPELDKWVNMGSTKAKNIIKRYGEIDRSEAIKDMIERDGLDIERHFRLMNLKFYLVKFITYQFGLWSMVNG